MKAIGYTAQGPVSAEGAVVEFETSKPQPQARDLLVAIHGISVNPVDVKLRGRKAPPEGDPHILGYDAAGVVVETGSEVSQFKPGDEIFYAGDFTRLGSNAEFQLVDERLVGRKPSSLDFAKAAGMPLTSITAWEILFDCFGLKEGEGAGECLLVIGAAGGVGSILMQLAKQLTGLTVIATASRPETQAWVKKMGADLAINHRNPIHKEMEALDIAPRYVAALTRTDEHFAAIVDLIKPRGHIALIDDPPNLDIATIKPKALSLSWEFMFTRSMFKTHDMEVQGALLNRVADLLDNGKLVSTVNHHGGELSVANLRAALELQASGTAIGKTVLDGYRHG